MRGDRKNYPVSLVWILVAVLLGVAFVASAQDIDIRSSDDMNNFTSGNVSTGNNKAFGFGYAMGDVDIAQCLGSEQWGTILGGKQRLVLNWPCMAEFYLRNGQPELAAMAVCNTEVLDEFESEEQCEAAHDFLAAIEPQAVVAQVDDDDEDYHEELEAELALLREDLGAIQQQRSQPRVIRQVEQTGLTDAQKAALREVVK